MQACIIIYLVKSSVVCAHTCASGMECEHPGTAYHSKTNTLQYDGNVKKKLSAVQSKRDVSIGF